MVPYMRYPDYRIMTHIHHYQTCTMKCQKHYVLNISSEMTSHQSNSKVYECICSFMSTKTKASTFYAFVRSKH